MNRYDLSDTPFGGFVDRIDAGPLKIFIRNEKIFADGLFKLHDERGFSLTDSLIQCHQRNWIPCTRQFVADAIRAGWTKDKAERVLETAESDSKLMTSTTSPYQ